VSPKATKKKQHPTDDILQELRAFGMAYPGAHFKSPWPGHMDLAVKDKTFAYLSVEGEPLGISCKLPRSSEVALMLPFCTPTAYGLGKSGWVSAKFEDADIDVEMLKAWIDESYRAQAPKKLVASLGAPPSEPAAKKPAAKKPAAKKPAAKKPAAKKPATRAR
jgi:predicted DNA-binding protein (MmcQ/YjbR family)